MICIKLKREHIIKFNFKQRHKTTKLIDQILDIKKSNPKF